MSASRSHEDKRTDELVGLKPLQIYHKALLGGQQLDQAVIT